MKAVTLNLWKNDGDFPARLAIIREGLALMRPEIICLQEAYSDKDTNALELVTPNSNYNSAFAPAREKLRGGRLSHSGVAILSIYPIIEQAILTLPTSINDGGRLALRADLALPTGIIRVVSLHLSHLQSDEGNELRALQWQAILDWAKIGWQAPILFGGDFNCLASTPWLQASLTSAPHQISADFLGGQTSLRFRPNALIDHLIVPIQAKMRINSATLCFNDAQIGSDHFGILAHLTTSAN